ncbi:MULTISPECIES: TetR/AcrR family transcriptional regulator C-terminal domain-containing protein [Arthrobacter]|uniref:TetR family transcriptional regulator n=1 Tax=Arthrobacter terricola TaxID=2547396 RepID=A0A4R5KSG4_9MICC|nr:MULTISPECIES: TetR/AcrR family transcriptional regulator C-terminal domain-containing protein [Arthrobacter]MBT8160632.1 TetR/AcrR family transcriptional regulator C-terminal domain-containing protein [Arthrobacter sp. GN70]TDF97790.1 TetR family transcriptional regulator [Arthrobacter terricola]
MQAQEGSGRLNRRTVLGAALELVDEHGLDALSMRRLGQALGRDPMAVYRHAANRKELLAGVAELVLDEVEIFTDDAHWQIQLRRMAHEMRRVCLRHPNVVPLLVTGPLSTPLGLRPAGTLRPLEQILGILIRAGFAPGDALHVYRAFYGFLYGHILNELQELIVDPEENEALLQLGLQRLPLREFPHLRRLAPELLEYDGEHELDQGITILLAGLGQQLETTSEAYT